VYHNNMQAGVFALTFLYHITPCRQVIGNYMALGFGYLNPDFLATGNNIGEVRSALGVQVPVENAEYGFGDVGGD
jgi:hypothetical protein